MSNPAKTNDKRETKSKLFVFGIAGLLIGGAFPLVMFHPIVALLPERNALAMSSAIVAVVGLVCLVLGYRQMPLRKRNSDAFFYLSFVAMGFVFQYFFMPDILDVFFGAK